VVNSHQVQTPETQARPEPTTVSLFLQVEAVRQVCLFSRAAKGESTVLSRGAGMASTRGATASSRVEARSLTNGVGAAVARWRREAVVARRGKKSIAVEGRKMKKVCVEELEQTLS
jgi:ABC-type cobalamin transport system ATPase subunit